MNNIFSFTQYAYSAYRVPTAQFTLTVGALQSINQYFIYTAYSAYSIFLRRSVRVYKKVNRLHY